MHYARIYRADDDPTDSKERVEVAETQRWDLAFLQGLVGGHVEALIVRGATMYFDEDGKAKGLPLNQLASRFLRERGVRLFPGDYIAGTAVLVGPATEAGYDTSLNGDVLEWAKAHAGRPQS